jgi:hypothetical protein
MLVLEVVTCIMYPVSPAGRFHTPSFVMIYLTSKVKVIESLFA